MNEEEARKIRDTFMGYLEVKERVCRWCNYAWAAVIILILLVFYIGIDALHTVAVGHIADRPELTEWLMAQKNSMNGVCCDGEDTIRLSDKDWGIENGHYWIVFNGQKRVVQDWQISPGGNRLPEALLWIWKGSVQCFKPATLF